MKNFLLRSTSKFVVIFVLLFLPETQLISQGFQRAYGNEFNNVGWQVVPHGMNYYVLQTDQHSFGALVRGAISYIDQTGNLLWVRRLNVASNLTDAELTPGGDLIFVGNTLPDGESSGGIMGSIDSDGDINWLNTYDQPGSDHFWDIGRSSNPDNPDFPYVVAGTQADDPGNAVDDNAVLMAVNESGALGWKKISIMPGDNELTHDMEILPNGDIILGGFWGFGGSIVWLNNAGEQVTAASAAVPSLEFTDITPASSGGFYAVGGTESEFYLSKLTEDFINYDFQIEGLTAITQVWEDGTTGAIDVVGRINIGGSERAVIINLTDAGTEFTQNWVKYLDNGETSYMGGSIWFLPPDQLAYTDGRINPNGGFGGFCTFLSVSDLALTTCMTVEIGMEITPESWLWEGPDIASFTFWDVPQPTPLSGTLVTWQEQEVCAEDSCFADFIFEHQNDCGQIIFTNLSSGTPGLNYCWDFDNNPGTCESTLANPTWLFPTPACQDWNVCLTITDANDCSAQICYQVSISDLVLPIMTCPADIVINCSDSALPAHTGSAQAADNCSIPVITYTDIVTGLYPCDATILRTWMAEDACNNFVTCVQTITVLDLNPPQIINCPPSITIQGTVGGNGQCTADVSMGSPVAQDNCDFSVSLINTFNLSNNASGVYPAGSTIVTWTATDDCNNTATCTTEVIVTCPMAQDNCCLEWAYKFGNDGDDNGLALDIDASGNTILGGRFQGTVDFDPGPGIYNLTATGSDAYVVKLDPSGNFIWAISFGGNGYDFVNDLNIDLFGNIILSGGFAGMVDFDPGAGIHMVNSIGSSSLFLSKLNSSGVFMLAFPVGGNIFSFSTFLSSDALGNIYITGPFHSTVDFDPGSGTSALTSTGIRDVFIAKYTSTGSLLWAGQIGGQPTSIIEVGGIDVDLAGNVGIVGNFRGTIDFDPGNGTSTLTSNILLDIYLVKWDVNGGFIWTKSFTKTSGTYDNHAEAIIFDNQGNLYTTGSFAGSADFDPGPSVLTLTSSGVIPGGSYDAYIAKLDPNGQLLWVKKTDGISGETGLALHLDSQGNVYTIGFFGGNTVDFDPGAGVHSITSTGTPTFFLKLKSTGDFIWAKVVDGFICIGQDIRVDLVGSIYSTGYFLKTVDFDPGVNVHLLSSTGINGHDAFVLKMGTCPPPAPCACQGFSQMYFNGLPAGNIPVHCNGNIENLGCPLPGTSLSLTGNFQCKNNNCPASPEIEWELEGPNGGIISNGTITSSISFALSIASSNFIQGGVYTLKLTGHCGSELCDCSVSFFIEDGCQPTCPCDQNEFLTAMRRGFATTYSFNDCNTCFVPLGLGDCDEVNWFINSPNGIPVGSTIGREKFCMTLTQGFHDVFMIVSRRNSGGIICATETFNQMINVTCTIRPDCNYSVFGNPEFDQGSVEGSLLPDSSGMTSGWMAHWGDPHEVTGDGGRWGVVLNGNSGYNDVLGTIEPICLEKNKGSITIRFGIKEQGIKSTVTIQFFTDEVFAFGECLTNHCYQIGPIELPAGEPNTFYEIEIPYDLSEWFPEDTCENLGAPIRAAVYVSNLLNDVQGISTRTEVFLDNFCTDGTIVATEDPQVSPVNFYPNPAKDIVYIETDLKIDDIKVSNVNGQDVRIKISADRPSELDISSLSTGIYYVFIRTGDQITSSKFVKF